MDEAVFWSVVLGASCPKLRALCKTGLFKEEAGGQLWTLLSHERANEPAFLRKNAFRLLELHRFHLAAALFLLAGSCEEALQIISRHLKDLQLCVLVARDPKHREALQKARRKEKAKGLCPKTLVVLLRVQGTYNRTQDLVPAIARRLRLLLWCRHRPPAIHNAVCCIDIVLLESRSRNSH